MCGIFSGGGLFQHWMSYALKVHHCLLAFFRNEKIKNLHISWWWDLIFFFALLFPDRHRTCAKCTCGYFSHTSPLAIFFFFFQQKKRDDDDGMRHVEFFHYPLLLNPCTLLLLLLLLLLHRSKLRGLIASFVEKKHRKQKTCICKSEIQLYTQKKNHSRYLHIATVDSSNSSSSSSIRVW